MKAIPLDKLNCTHCSLLPSCTGWKVNSANGKPDLPRHHYCSEIFKNYKLEGEPTMDSDEYLEETGNGRQVGS